jgi:hypothetical protein
MENKQMAAQTFGLTLRTIFDPDTGNVFTSFNRHVIPLGNIRTGALYLFRQYPLAEDGSLSMPGEHKSVMTVKVPEDTLEMQIDFIAQLALFIGMGFQLHPAPDDYPMGEFMGHVTDATMPEMVEKKVCGMHLVILMMEGLLAGRKGQTSFFELSKDLERAAGFFSTMPEAYLTAPIAFKQEGVTLVDGDGMPMQ